MAVARGYKADEGSLAASDELAKVPALSGEQPDRARAIKYNGVEEFDVSPGPPQLAKGEKGLRGDGG